MKSYQYPAAVRKHSTLRGLAKYVLMIPATYVDDSGECYPSYATLVNDSGLSLKTVIRAIKAIVQVKELQIVEKGKAIGCPNKYRITINYSPTDHSSTPNYSPTDHSQNGNCGPTDHGTMVTQSINYGPTDHLTTKELPIKLPKARNRASSSSVVSTPKNGNTDPQIPLMLQTAPFLKAWADFDHYRRNGKRKKEWTARAKELGLDECLKLGEASAIRAINYSILNGYTGIFLPNNHDQKPKRFVDEFGV